MQDSNWIDRLQWVKLHSVHTRAAAARLGDSGRRPLVLRFHVDLKMIPVIESLSEHFEVLLFPCHGDTTDPQGWAYLKVHSPATLESEWSPQLCSNFLERHSGGHLCDLGGEMIACATRHGWPVKAAMEGTTSGLSKIQAAAQDCPLKFPVLDWNNARLKREIHNEKMVGFSIWQTFTEVTRLSLHGKSVGVVGFGPVGRGIARTARSLGGVVRVYDPSAECRTLAAFEGFPTPTREKFLGESEILVTATGRDDVLSLTDLCLVPWGAILLNAGHSEAEWEEEIRRHPRRQTVLSHVERLDVSPAHHVYLLAGGRLLNLAAGFGDTINAFDLTSAQLLATIQAMLHLAEDTPAGVRTVDPGFFETALSDFQTGLKN